MKIIVLAAGKSTRFKSKKHKALHLLLGKPILERVLDTLWELNPEQVQMVLGHQLQEILPLLTRGETHVKQAEQLGSGHALGIALNNLTDDSEGFLVVNSDTPLFRSTTLRNLINSVNEATAQIGVLTAQVKEPFSYGRILRAQDQILSIIEEKEASAEQKLINEVNAGAYFFKLSLTQLQEGIQYITKNNKNTECYLTCLIEWANLQKYKVVGYKCLDKTEIIGLNTKAELAHASELLSKRRQLELQANGVLFLNPESTMVAPEVQIAADTTIFPNCYLFGETSIGESCSIGPGAYIENSSIGNDTNVRFAQIVDSTIGSECSVGPYASLRNKVILADNVYVGSFVEVKNSKVASESKIPHLSYVGDAELGSEVNIGAGTITANYNAISGEKSQTKLGNKVKVGSNSVFVAPIELAEGCMVAAGTIVTENVLDKDSLVIARSEQEVKKNWVSDKKKKLNKESQTK
jgi:bifunctional UDP-N-acetylglucosamine pyrophosphorylase/glucosamine-1-phosphate N-acetyltransferase